MAQTDRLRPALTSVGWAPLSSPLAYHSLVHFELRTSVKQFGYQAPALGGARGEERKGSTVLLWLHHALAWDICQAS